MALTLTAVQPAFGQNASASGKPIKVAVVGLVHDHIAGFLPQLSKHADVELVGIVESNPELVSRYSIKFHLASNLFYPELETMLVKTHPDAVLVYTSIADHRAVIETAAKHGVNVMVEKPLATTLADALAIQSVAQEHKIQVLVNYETTWYASNRQAHDIYQSGKLGDVRRVVVHDGHKGPIEIGVSKEFGKWLTDPAQNGAGALFDFGCYGADLMTWLMNGQRPLSVTAVTQTDKIEMYPHVDDEATVIIRYPKAQAILMASWNWPFDRKDMEIYGATGYVITVGPDALRLRYAGESQESRSQAPPLTPPEDNSLDFLVSALRAKVYLTGTLSSLDTNVVVMEILDAARESAKTGKTVVLGPLPK